MPWTSIIMFVLSFLVSKSKGRSIASSAGIAALAAGATYLIADPANSSNLMGIGQGAGTVGSEKTNPGNTSITSGLQGGTPGSVSTAGTTAAGNSWWDSTVETVGSTLSSWGGAGTAAVIGTTALATGNTSTSKMLIVGATVLGVILLLK